MLNNTKLRHFWAQIVSWAPRHARKTFIVLAPSLYNNNTVIILQAHPFFSQCIWSAISGLCPSHSLNQQPQNLLLNLRSPRDCGSSCRSRLWYFLSPLDGASVREAHCAQASTAVRRTEARRLGLQCAKCTARRLLSDRWTYGGQRSHAIGWKLEVCVVLPSSDRWQQCVREAPLHAYSYWSTCHSYLYVTTKLFCMLLCTHTTYSSHGSTHRITHIHTYL